ncbi:hypothetical protein Pedsa_1360 [Pseudopedobacter saltans DSM 12145]|uniref:Uncharacterized protein n=1 Tax=Pseudopedobacter saltans (strain ATCC 51119 / DSM 12145 / JCM 21818 / CCUG 39354 / LMG 10337 / NBRC 100064 / NCIMB 13643) TaxID=762903 RepID=F0SEN7_PSESL|nr:hypothetical protein [Pseudopedobacter saltans]ADY51927.1 hypothetical protein Pedsa_1360 [Pseudopedobacter saltans DSM 12145]
MRFILTVFTCFISLQLSAFNEFNINNFVLSENPQKSNTFIVIAKDSLNNASDALNGTYNFSINGFKETLNFHSGVAASKMEIDKSLFLYIKHENENNTVSKLYYLRKTDNGINPIGISWYILLIIPASLILIGYMFRKIIGVVIFFLMAYIYFSYSKGLSVSTFLESIFDGLKNLF